jgi:poly(hydroxyalkanoate) polymerase-like protein
VIVEKEFEIDAPGREIAVTHAGPKDHRHEDVQVALSDAFDAAVRRLEDQAKGEVEAAEREAAASVLAFAGCQLLDLWAPSNFVATNPEVLRATIEQSGAASC